MVIFAFLQQYIQELEGSWAIQVWARFLQLAKDVLASPRETKSQVYPTLR